MLNYDSLNKESGFIIAETACGHEGDLKKLFQLIDCVASSGAPAIKFQIFVPTERSHPKHSEWKIFNDLTLTPQEWQKAADYARGKSLNIFADVFGDEGLQIAKSINVDGYKVHSEDLLNSFFIKKVAQEGKILFVGVGASHRIEIFHLINFLKREGLLNQIILMPGVQTFPTPIEAHSLSELADLIRIYEGAQVRVGFADHIDGDLPQAMTLPLMALTQGAVVIEKHITVDRAWKWEDYQSALGADQFKEFVGMVRESAGLLKSQQGMNSHELKYRQAFKKCAVARLDLSKGCVLKEDDIEFRKFDSASVPLSGLNLVGKTLKESVPRGKILRCKHLYQKVGGIIVARCTSSRLPSKATRKILGKETIFLLIERIKRAKNLDCVVLATSSDPSDDILEGVAKKAGADFFRGSLDNLSLRFYEAAKHFGIDQIVRITGDDILRDEVMIDRAVESHLHESSDVTFTKNMPYGTSSEIFSLNVLETVLNTVNVPKNTEYLEWFLENDRYFNVNTVASEYEFSNDVRLTLDYEEDFELFKSIFEHFYPTKPDFTLPDVLDWIKAEPQILEINKHKTAKYTRNDINVTLKI